MIQRLTPRSFEATSDGTLKPGSVGAGQNRSAGCLRSFPAEALDSRNKRSWGGMIMIVNRRTFSAMLAGAVATPRMAFAQAKDNCAFYSGVGGQLTHYRGRFRRRHAGQTRGGHAAGRYSVRMAASVAAIPLCGDELRRTLGSRRSPDIRPTNTISWRSMSRRSASFRSMAPRSS